MRWPERKPDLVLLLGLLLFNLCGLGRIGLFDVDEAIFAEATREMVVSGDYITPRYNGGERWDKPPLIYWAMSPAVALLGPSPLAARLTATGHSLLLALLLLLAGTALLGRSAGRWAAVAMVVSLHGYFMSHQSVADLTLVLLMGAGWLALYQAAERQSPRWFLAAAVALAAATLTKGPVALVLPGGCWLLWLLWRRRLWRTLDATHCWWGFLLYGLLLLPWCLEIYRRHHLAFYETFLGYHNLDRLTRTQSGHGGPIYTFPLVLLIGFAPWSGYLLAGLGEAWHRRREPAARPLLFCALWLVTVVGLFSLSQTKLPNYISPAYPAAALLAGWVAAQVAAGAPRQAHRIALPALLGCALAGLGIASLGAWLPGLPVLARELPGSSVTVGPGPLVGGLLLAVVATAAAVLGYRQPRRYPLASAATGLTLCWVLWFGLAPVIYRYQQGTVRLLTAVAVRQMANGGEFLTLNIHNPSVAFTGRRLFTRLTWPADSAWARWHLARRFAAPQPVFLLTRSVRVGGLLDSARCWDWATRDGWRLVANRPPPAGWELPPSPWTERQARLAERKLAADVEAASGGLPR
ncbi:MAG: glycosyltransferase family 39 protein [Fimbriimonadaceae bacterium]|nr:glycosyltransferase family 39 protein [Fimbriimonadaceae bacterium]